MRTKKRLYQLIQSFFVPSTFQPLEISDDMQNRRSEDGCEDAVERESETGKSTITIADAKRPRRPYGMRRRAHRQALSYRAMDARPAHYAKAHNASEDAYADHYRRR